MKQNNFKHLLLILSFLLGINAFSQSTITVGDLEYSIHDNEASVASVIYENWNIVIPSVINWSNQQFKVTSIGEKAFYKYYYLSSITIPNSVTSIGNEAFSGCSNLASITIPNSVTSIGNEAFSGCSDLASITILNSVTAIGYSAFYGTQWYNNQPDGPVYINNILYRFKGTMPSGTSLVIKKGTVSISPTAFSGYSGLASITIPNSVTTIGYRAFYGCSGLASITIPNSVTAIGEEAFSGTKWYNNQPDGSVYINNVLYCFKGTMPSGTSLVIKEGTVSISPAAFSGCSGLASITIPNSVTTIGESAFSGCSGLASITIPNSVTAIGESAFYKCSGLASITIPNSVTAIGESAFYGCSGLTSINIPDSLATIGQSAFSGCTKLTYVLMPSSLKSFGSDIFSGCYGMEYIINLTKFSLTSTNTGCSSASIIGPKDLVSWNDSVFTYTGKCPNTNVINKAPLKLLPSTSTVNALNKDAGTYTDSIPLTFTNSDMSFNVNVPYTYIINKAKLTATVENATRMYGDNNPTFISEYTGFIEGENNSVLVDKDKFTCSAIPNSNVGTYSISQPYLYAKNYDIKKVDGTLTITKAPLSIQPENAQKAYGSANPSFAIKCVGLKNNENEPAWISRPTIETDATTNSEVGSYTISINGGEARNYSLSKAEGILTVNKAELNITANNASRLYYEDNPKLTCFYDGFVNNEDTSVLTSKPTLSTAATKTSDAGTYTIAVGNADAKNYRINYNSGILTIGKQTLTVSTENYKRVYLEQNPEINLQYSGFVNNENESNLLVKPKATTIATQQSDVGTYQIGISGGVAVNYDFYYNGGTLTIEKAYQTISWNQDLNDIEQYSQVELTSSASSGLPITYNVENSDICSVMTIGSKSYLDCSKTGETVVSAKQEGNNNYYPTTKVYKTIRVINTTGIGNVYDGEGLKVIGNKVCVKNLPANQTLKIYNDVGNLIYEGRDAEIPIEKGFYIIRVGKWSQKITTK